MGDKVESMNEAMASRLETERKRLVRLKLSAAEIAGSLARSAEEYLKEKNQPIDTNETKKEE